MTVFWLIVAAGGLGLYWLGRKGKKEAATRKQTREELRDLIIQDDIEVLVRKRRQLVYVDDYGDECFDRWEREVNRYIDKRFMDPSDEPIEGDELRRLEYATAVEKSVQAYSNTHPNKLPDLDEVTDPLEYERQVAHTLDKLGWEARTTVATGDQGADIIASKDGIRLVIQCKLYSQPIGNSAVQEAFAAKQHQKADLAAVVTNTGFTKSARQLANTTGVFLLHHEELTAFDEAVFNDDEDEEA